MTVARIEDVAAGFSEVAKDIGAMQPNVRKITTDQDRAPLPSDDETQGYTVGSRWQWQGQEWFYAGQGRWVRQGVVTPQMFGARGNGVVDDTAALKAAVSHLKMLGGGTLHFPAGIYLAHVATPNYSSSTPDTHALLVDFDGLHLRGDGPGVSVLRAMDDQGGYGLIRYGVLPIQNGVTQIRDCSIAGLTLDGNNANPMPRANVRQGVIMASGLGNCQFTDMQVTRGSAYGIGLQNGGHDTVVIDRVVFSDCGRNAVDVKNNGSKNRAISITNCVVDHCGWADYDDETASMMSITGDGCHISDITFINPPTGARTIGRVLRIKPGTEVFTQGVGGRAVTVSDVTILLGATPPASMTCVVELGCDQATLSNIVIRGPAPIGIQAAQPWVTITGGIIDGPAIGIQTRNKTVLNSAQAYDGADDVTIMGVQILNCATAGVHLQRPRATVIGSVITACGTGVQTASGAADTTIALNTIRDCPVPITYGSSTGIRVFGNTGAVNPIFRAILEGGEARHLAIDFGMTARFYGADGGETLRLRHRAGAVNYIDIYPGLSGNPAEVTASGTDADVGLRLSGKGNGPVIISPSSVQSFTDSAAAIAGGVPVGGLYFDSTIGAISQRRP